MQSFIHVPASSHFPLHNLPYGIFTNKSLAGQHHIGVAIGEHVLDLAVLSRAGLLQGPCLEDTDCFKQASTLPLTCLKIGWGNHRWLPLPCSPPSIALWAWARQHGRRQDPPLCAC